MKRLLFVFFLLCLLPAMARADTYYTTTYYPAADSGWDNWTASSAGDKVDDINEGAVPDDEDQIYAVEPSGGVRQTWLFDPDSTTQGEIIDTVVFWIRYSCDDKCGTEGLGIIWYSIWHWESEPAGDWVRCTNDTTFAATIYYVEYACTMTTNPCTASPWRWVDLDRGIGYYLWGVQVKWCRTSCFPQNTCRNYVSWAALTVKSHTVAAEAGHVIIIGAINEENHNSRFGIPASAWK